MGAIQGTSSHRIILEIRESKSALICQHCDKPILEISDEALSIVSKHGSSKHANVLTIEQVEFLLFEMKRRKLNSE